jgi:hypothetical protein
MFAMLDFKCNTHKLTTVKIVKLNFVIQWLIKTTIDISQQSYI